MAIKQLKNTGTGEVRFADDASEAYHALVDAHPTGIYHKAGETDSAASEWTDIGAAGGGSSAQVFEVTDLTIPAGTDFTEPMEIGRFSLDYTQMIVAGVVSIDYDSGADQETLEIFVAPVARRTPSLSGYLYAASSSGFGDVRLALASGNFHFWQAAGVGSHIGLFDSSAEVPADGSATEFGVYLSPHPGDVNGDGTSYQTMIVHNARAALLFI